MSRLRGGNDGSTSWKVGATGLVRETYLGRGCIGIIRAFLFDHYTSVVVVVLDVDVVVVDVVVVVVG